MLLKRRLAFALAAGALIACLGVASAFADDGGPSSTTTIATSEPASSANCPSDVVDQHGPANDAAEAVTDVQSESDSEATDEERARHLEPSDESADQGDDCEAGSDSTTPVACPGDVAGAQHDVQGADQEDAAADIAEAAAEVRSASASKVSDDRSGDQQGPGDQSEEQDDSCHGDHGGGDQQSGDEQSGDEQGADQSSGD
jgi:hypothetical protein